MTPVPAPSESTMTPTLQARQVPLIDRLLSVPPNAVLRIDTPNALGFDTRSIPVGLLCHEAAAALSLPAAAPEGVKPGTHGWPDTQDEKFLWAWVKLAELPGGMMTSSDVGRFGPIPALTSTIITTSPDEANAWRARGEPVLQVFVKPVAASPSEGSAGDAPYYNAIDAAMSNRTPRPTERKGNMDPADCPRLAGDAPAAVQRLACQHEPFEGRCVHCNVSFIDGRPAYVGDDDDVVIENRDGTTEMTPTSAAAVQPEQPKADKANLTSQERDDLQTALPKGWNPNTDGAMPQGYGVVDLLFRDGDMVARTPVTGWIWKHHGEGDDIVGWRGAACEALAGEVPSNRLNPASASVSVSASPQPSAAQGWQFTLDEVADAVERAAVPKEAAERFCELLALMHRAKPVAPLKDSTLAMAFHEAYERLAPKFGYATRPETREFDPDSPNGKLMIAVVGELRASLNAATPPEAAGAAQPADLSGDDALRNGWPKCCGSTMTIDSPQWRAAHRKADTPSDAHAPSGRQQP